MVITQMLLQISRIFQIIQARQTRVTKQPSGISSLVERALWERNARGSIPRSPIFHCAIAQLAERPPVKREVPGSNPGGTALKIISGSVV